MEKTEIANTKNGKIQGYIDDNVSIFKGIPFAEPPVGKLRFEAPVRKSDWSGVLETTEYSSESIQPPPMPGSLLSQETFPQNEGKCLTLNVWSPGLDDKKRPVMIWIHGGDFVRGSGSRPIYSGSNLVKQGDIIVVTINYRLGALGFLYLPEIATANAGSLDQILALRWVKENIRKFGGDPENITIFGESAGAWSVITLCAMPMAKGLFHRVIAQSTPNYYASNGKKATDDLFQMLGIKNGDIDALRKISTEKLLDAQVKIYMKSSSVTSTNPWAPLVDGKILLQDPLEFFRQGKTNIELLIGSNLDENKLFSFMDPRAPEIDITRVKKRVQRFMNLFGQEEGRSNRLIDVYLDEREDNAFSLEPRDLYDNIATDLWFRILSIRLAEAQSKKKSSFMYLFTWESPFKHPKQGALGSAHAVEIPFIFNSLNLPGMEILSGRGKDADALSGNMMQSWISFARTGNPNHAGIPEWDHYDSETRSTMILGKKIESVKDPFRKTRIIWDGII